MHDGSVPDSMAAIGLLEQFAMLDTIHKIGPVRDHGRVLTEAFPDITELRCSIKLITYIKISHYPDNFKFFIGHFTNR